MIWKPVVGPMFHRTSDDKPWVIGERLTGFDYLGEPTPYESWPSRGSYFGINDLAGLPKDRYYLYRSRWNTEKPLHILPHWNWEGREGQTTPVLCTPSYTSAELYQWKKGRRAE
jgi:beta-galactosidase